MNSLTFDPFGDLDRLAAHTMGAGPRSVPVDLCRSGDHYILTADLPGVDPGSVDINVDGNLLTVRAERTPATHEDAKWIVQERRGGNYYRQFTLGDGIDTEKISASYDNGVLSLLIPMSERAKPRKIELTPADQQALSS